MALDGEETVIRSVHLSEVLHPLLDSVAQAAPNAWPARRTS